MRLDKSFYQNHQIEIMAVIAITVSIFIEKIMNKSSISIAEQACTEIDILR